MKQHFGLTNRLRPAQRWSIQNVIHNGGNMESSLLLFQFCHLKIASATNSPVAHNAVHLNAHKHSHTFRHRSNPGENRPEWHTGSKIWTTQPQAPTNWSSWSSSPSHSPCPQPCPWPLPRQTPASPVALTLPAPTPRAARISRTSRRRSWRKRSTATRELGFAAWSNAMLANWAAVVSSKGVSSYLANTMPWPKRSRLPSPSLYPTPPPCVPWSSALLRQTPSSLSATRIFNKLPELTTDDALPTCKKRELNTCRRRWHRGRYSS